MSSKYKKYVRPRRDTNNVPIVDKDSPGAVNHTQDLYIHTIMNR